MDVLEGGTVSDLKERVDRRMWLAAYHTRWEGGGMFIPPNKRATVQPLGPWQYLKLLRHSVADDEAGRTPFPVFEVAEVAGVEGVGDAAADRGASSASFLVSSPDQPRRAP